MDSELLLPVATIAAVLISRAPPGQRMNAEDITPYLREALKALQQLQAETLPVKRDRRSAG